MFSKLFSTAWTNAISIRNIMSGFKVCGICPFDRNDLRLPLEEVPKPMETLAKKSGLAYIPLFSPAKQRRNDHHRSESSDSSRSIHSPSTSRHYKRNHPSSDQHCRSPSLQHDPASKSLSSFCGRDMSSQHQRSCCSRSSSTHFGHSSPSSSHHHRSSNRCVHSSPSSSRHDHSLPSFSHRGRSFPSPNRGGHYSSSYHHGRSSRHRNRSSPLSSCSGHSLFSSNRRGHFFRSLKHHGRSSLSSTRCGRSPPSPSHPDRFTCQHQCYRHRHSHSSSAHHSFSSGHCSFGSRRHRFPSSIQHRRHQQDSLSPSAHLYCSSSHCRNPSSDYSFPPTRIIKSSHHRRSSSYPKHQTSSPHELHMLAAHNGSLSTLLVPPLKEVTQKPPQKKSCGQILTSKENIKAMEEKERVKKEKIRLKEERKQQLEKRRQEKAELATARSAKRKLRELKKESVQGGQKRQLLNKNLNDGVQKASSGSTSLCQYIHTACRPN